jgi:putative peptide zinc metalloprotease protein
MPPNPSNQFDSRAVLPCLRSDLVISQQKFQGKTSYVIKDPVSLRYYRLGPRELHLAGLLDGKKTVAEVTEEMQEKFPDAAIDEETVMRIFDLFMRMSFLQLSGERAQTLFTGLVQLRRTMGSKVLPMRIAGSIVSFKLALFDPDLLLLRMEKSLRFIWTRAALIVFTSILALSLGLVLANGDQFVTRLSDFLTLHNLFLLWLTLIIVKIVHEFGHGLTCKHYGGEVHEMGAFFIVLTPFLYCDATDSWKFPNKWHRIAVDLGGIFFELFLASFAVLVWVFTQPGMLHELAFNVMVVCSINTIVFNANPLMKFDGYYALADWMEVPNLRSKAGQYLSGLAVGLVTGGPTPAPEGYGPLRQKMFAVYGVASYLYSFFIIYRLTLMIGYRLEPYGLAGLGRTLAVLTMSVGFVFPIVQLGKHLRRQPHADSGGSVLKRRLARVGAGLAVGVLLLLIVPWKLQVTSSCVLDGGNRVAVRARSNGFVRSVLVKEGDLVRKDQVVAVLENPDLQNQFQDVESQMQILDLWRQRATAKSDASALKQVEADTSGLMAMRNRLQQEIDALQLKAPAAGVVMTAELDLKKGAYLREGDLLCDVIPPERVRIVIPLSEGEAGLVRTGQPVELRIYAFPGRVFHGTVAKTLEAGSTHLPHAALAARFGGDIPTEIDHTNTERPVDILYQAELQIENVAHLLRPGMSGRARVVCGRTTPARIVGSHLRNILRLDFRV